MNTEKVVAPILPVILSGGSGTRLWPVSRQSMPKQFQNLAHDNLSLFQQTLMRLDNIALFAAPVIVSHQDHRFIIEQNALETGVPLSAIILEPEQKNTAIAITVAALWAQKEGHKYILSLASDHVISDADSFQSDVQKALEQCKKHEEIIYFGIKPTAPHSGYGYLMGKNGKIESFIEKPPLEKAQGLIKEKDALWNSGIFLIPVENYLKQNEILNPEISGAANAALNNAKKDMSFLRLCANAYSQSPAIAFDKAYCERIKEGRILKASFSWSDIGSWDSVYDHGEKDDQNTVKKGNVVTNNVVNSYISSDGLLVAASDINDLVIVATKDAILVSARNKSQEIGGIVNKLRDINAPQASEHFIKYRPWGSYEVVSESTTSRIVKMKIKPGESLTLQTHQKRSEHWIVVFGTLEITMGGETIVLKSGQSTYAEAMKQHKLTNTGDTVAELIEIQIGAFAEDDVQRLESRG